MNNSNEQLWIEPAVYAAWWNPISWWERLINHSWWLMRSYTNTTTVWCVGVYRTKREAQSALDRLLEVKHE